MTAHSLRRHAAIQASVTQPDALDALIASHRAALDLAVQATDFPTVIARVGELRRRINWFERHGRETALGGLGENGLAPAIEQTLRSALFHGKPWKSAREMDFPETRRMLCASMAAERMGAVV